MITLLWIIFITQQDNSYQTYSNKFMAKYINNNEINLVRANDLEDFNCIREAIWNLISSIYQSKQDLLIADKNLNSLRQKFLVKFTPKVPASSNRNNKSINKPILVSIKKIPPLISTKLQEVNQIFKYFKNIKLVNISKQSPKSYIQVSKQGINTSEVIKIKKNFPALDAKKINQIYNIVNSNPKAKPYIQITTKELSRKQIIIPMNSNNIVKFIKNSSLHITNINQSLRNLKSEVLVDFIYLDLTEVMVVINKITVQSDLCIIEKYIKNVDDIDSLNVEVSQLPQSKFYLKIIGIPYFFYNKSQECLSSSNVEQIIKQNQIFNNIILTSKP